MWRRTTPGPRLTSPLSGGSAAPAAWQRGHSSSLSRTGHSQNRQNLLSGPGTLRAEAEPSHTQHCFSHSLRILLNTAHKAEEEVEDEVKPCCCQWRMRKAHRLGVHGFLHPSALECGTCVPGTWLQACPEPALSLQRADCPVGPGRCWLGGAETAKTRGVEG